MSNVRDKITQKRMELHNVFIPDFLKAISSKHDSKEIEKLLVHVKRLKEELSKDIEDGASEEFKKHANLYIGKTEEELNNEKKVFDRNAILELQEEKRLKTLVEKFKSALNELKKKKVTSPEVEKDLRELGDFFKQVHSGAVEQEKQIWNMVHGHEGLRFLHLRNIHAVANRMKVLERYIKKDVSREKNVESEIEKLLDSIINDKIKSQDEFRKVVKDLEKSTHEYISKASTEFKELTEASNMDALLLHDTLRQIGEFEKILQVADSKGYNPEESKNLHAKLELEKNSGQEITRHLLTDARAITNFDIAA